MEAEMEQQANWRDNAVVGLKTAGRILGLCQSATYDAASRGDIPVIQLGKLKKVSVAWLKRTVDGEQVRP
jgi:hypothetical protein